VTLEVAWEALEHAGIAPSRLAGTDTGVFMGVCCDDYGRRLLEDLPRLEAWTGIGSSLCAVANRVSHALDLRGPSLAIDTACSASLVAVHQACHSLRSGETSLALAGGVMLVASPSFALVLGAAGALSPDGTSRAFDASANGYVRSEGCAILALKRLADADRDGDRVLAVVRGSAVCQDGRTNGIMAPSQQAQEDLVRAACRNAQVPLDSIDYVEAHGTGTPVGDPIEIGALSATVGLGRPGSRPCLVGSVKTNIGHLEAASGVAGIIKVVLALRHGWIPATLAGTGLNPAIGWDGSGLRVVSENMPWPPSPGHPRRGGVGNYGYGGTLAHVILEEAPTSAAASAPVTAPAPDVAGRTRLFPLSGASDAGLRHNAVRLAAWLAADEDTPLTAIGHTLAHGRSALSFRACVVAADRAELATRLGDLAAGRAAPGTSSGRVRRETAPVWVFSGHGAQWPGMGRELLHREPALGQVLDEIDEIYRAELGISARRAIEDGDLGDTGQIQALIFAMQVGLARIEHAAIIGHSVGEVAAAVTAGLLDLAAGARLICLRARLLRRVAGAGAMVMVNLPFEEAAARLDGNGDVVAAIAASPSSTVLSGEISAVQRSLDRWPDKALTPRRINSDVAFHSPQMEILLPDLLAGAACLVPRPGEIPVYTTALDDPRANPPRDAAYWAANLRNPVRFRDAVAAAAQDGHRTFVEVSTHPVVAHSIMQTLAANGADDGLVVPTLRRDKPEQRTLLGNLGTLQCHGARVDWSAQYPARELADLPTTAWQHRRHWAEPAAPAAPGTAQHDVHSQTLLGHRTTVQGTSPVTLWQTRIDAASRPYPGGHQVLGTEILPAAVVLTSFLATRGTDALADVVLRVPLALTAPRDVQIVRQGQQLKLSSRLADQTSDQAWVTHATARAVAGGGLDGRLRPFIGEALDPGCVLDRLRDIGVAGIGFPWQVDSIRRRAGHLLVKIAADPDGSQDPASWGSLIDAALSAAPIAFPGSPRLRMPGRLAEMTVQGEPLPEALVGIEVADVRWDGDQAGDVEVNVVIAGLDGALIARLAGVRFGVVQQTQAAAADGPDAPRPRDIGAAVRGTVAFELRLDPGELDVERPLSDMGVDSLLSEAIRQRLSSQFRMALPSGLLWERPSVQSMADYLSEMLEVAGGSR
jgi:6-methylsalicylic acid synthase